MDKFDILTQSAVLLAFPKYDCSTECYYNKDDNSICITIIDDNYNDIPRDLFRLKITAKDSISGTGRINFSIRFTNGLLDIVKMFDIENNSDTSSELITEYDYILKKILDYFKSDGTVK